MSMFLCEKFLFENTLLHTPPQVLPLTASPPNFLNQKEKGAKAY